MPKPDGNILARWQTSLANTACSPLEFFNRVETSLIEGELPDLKISQINRREGGWFTPRRIYLRASYQKLYFDISSFVAGSSLVVGWWLHKDLPDVFDLLAEIPCLGFLIEKTTSAATYYTVDFIEYFERSVHNTILQVIDELLEESESAFLPDEARKPIWEELW